jgi:hypothetical protein
MQALQQPLDLLLLGMQQQQQQLAAVCQM